MCYLEYLHKATARKGCGDLILTPPLREVSFLFFFVVVFFYQIRFDCAHSTRGETFFSTEENTSIKIPA